MRRAIRRAFQVVVTFVGMGFILVLLGPAILWGLYRANKAEKRRARKAAKQQ